MSNHDSKTVEANEVDETPSSPVVPRTKCIKIEMNIPERSLYSYLALACRMGNLEAVVSILNTVEFDLDTIDDTPDTLNSILYVTLKNGHLDVAEELLKRGADPNYCGGSGKYPLVRACYSNDEKAAALLLKYRADPNVYQTERRVVTPLTACFGHKSNYTDESKRIIRLLLDHGADPSGVDGSGNSPLQLAIEEHDHEMIDLLLKPRYPTDVASLLCCAREYDPTNILHDDNLPWDMFNEIMKHASISADPDQGLHLSVIYGDGKTIEKLLKRGADPNNLYTRKILGLKSKLSALDCAIVFEHEKDIIQMLLDYGAKPQIGPFVGKKGISQEITEMIEKAAK